MIFSLTWLPEVLEQAGLKVSETQDWRSRGRGPMGTVRGVMCHHTATAAPGNMPSLRLLINGRPAGNYTPALAGPLAQLGLGRDGTFYVIAAGRANHAGAGEWEGVTTGNSSLIGIEAENNGVGETWPPVQLDAYQRGVAAILKKIGAGANMCCGHKEYAAPPGRKSDPAFDMPAFRREVAAFLSGKTPTPPIPAIDSQQRPTLRRGSMGPVVEQAQLLLNVHVDGLFGPSTEASLRAFQRSESLVPDGILGPKTWARLSSAAPVVRVAGPGAGAPNLGQTGPGSGVVLPGDAAAVVGALPAIRMPVADTPTDPPTLNGRTAIGPGGEHFAVVSKTGFFTVGETPLTAWVATNPLLPATVSKSVVNVVSAMSTVEGGLEAINSYDDAHLSFGVFQWTAGSGDGAGELAILLARFKEADPDAYEECFGRFGLGADVAGPSETTGLLTLGGTPLQTSVDKNALRSIEWAYRFWRAAHHPSLRLCEFTLAASRIDRFQSKIVFGKPLRDWMNSELAIALLLDEHVNRPGHVPSTLLDAIKEIGMEDADPATFADEQEHRLIDAYLDKRDETNMTDSRGRAAKIEHFVTLGRLSDKRGSFRPSPA